MSVERRAGQVAVIGLLLTFCGGCGGASEDLAPAPGAAAAPAGGAPGGPESAAGESAAGGVAESNVAVKEMLQPWTGDLDGMVERRYIRFLVAYNKTHYFFDGPQQHGITYESGKAFEDFVNERLGSKAIRVNVVFLPVSRDRLLTALVEGGGDIAAAGLTITPERQEIVEFSAPGWSGVREVVVTNDRVPPLASPEELSGRKVLARPSSSYHSSLVALNERLAAAGKAPVDIVAADEQLEDEDLLEMVSAGVIEAVVVDDYLADLWSQVFTNLRIHREAAVREGGRIAWALRKGSPELREVVDAFIGGHGKGTLFGNVVIKRYLGSTQWVKNPTAEEEYRRFRQTADLFRKYGDEYDLPWLLVAAQAYQESGIDQTKVSSAGAVGVMQIKPSTAEGHPILITGVDADVEKNIQAGAKYLRFIVDQYYADEPMERLDKGLFAVASYNAGPARVARLRKQAAEMGLDPNRWFGNVEVVAGREIGRETVQYVSNIYKYFVTYNLVAAGGLARPSPGPG
jgi:membrane-bound lytic murein transglycosylase MltF